MGITLYDYCMKNNRPELIPQWHPTKNGRLTPKDVFSVSTRKLWWKCEKGHEWTAQIDIRVAGANCPICAGRRVVAGENDLATTHPEIAAMWHPTKNGSDTPQMANASNRRKVWWRCSVGHEWQASICSRTAEGGDCPVCGGKTVISGTNDLMSMYPELAAEWHPVRNGGLLPKDVSPQSYYKVWWVCDRGHEYAATIRNRTARAEACPYCEGKKVLVGFNDLATEYPEIASQWHPTMNESLTPEAVSSRSVKKVWWRCAEGHEWRAVVFSRTGEESRGCPFCAGKVDQKRPAKYKQMLEILERKTGAINEAHTI